MPIFNLWTHSMCPYRFFYSSRLALGIGAASFASGIQERGKGIWGRGRDLGTGRASKDIAESPTASPERPKLIHNA